MQLYILHSCTLIVTVCDTFVTVMVDVFLSVQIYICMLFYSYLTSSPIICFLYYQMCILSVKLGISLGVSC